MQVRLARADDAAGMCAVINPIIAKGGTTAHQEPFTPERMIAHYIAHPRGVCCYLAEDAAGVAGFQGLFRRDPQPDLGMGEGWAAIGSFVGLDRQGQGVGRALWAATRAHAEAQGLRHLDATIRRENTGGQRFYAGLGFRDYRESAETVSKRFDLA